MIHSFIEKIRATVKLLRLVQTLVAENQELHKQVQHLCDVINDLHRNKQGTPFEPNNHQSQLTPLKNVEAHIDGEISGQIATGNNNLQTGPIYNNCTFNIIISTTEQLEKLLGD